MVGALQAPSYGLKAFVDTAGIGNVTGTPALGMLTFGIAAHTNIDR